MKTDELAISPSGAALDVMLDKIELIALYTGMKRREATSMRLLAEELLTATRDLTKHYQSRLWMETTDKTFSLHMLMDKPVYKSERDKLVALSKTGSVTPPKGLFSRLGAAMSRLLLLDENDDMVDVIFSDYALYPDSASMGGPICCYHYIPVRTADVTRRAEEQPRDELAGIEKNIIDAIVDDIMVRMSGGSVEIVAVKNL